MPSFYRWCMYLSASYVYMCYRFTFHYYITVSGALHSLKLSYVFILQFGIAFIIIINYNNYIIYFIIMYYLVFIV